MTTPLDIKPRRVLLVGATPLESDLRRQPEIELVRCPSLFDALGEASEAPRAERLGVILAPDAADSETTDEFERELRALAPAARLLRPSNGRPQTAADVLDALDAPPAQAPPAPSPEPPPTPAKPRESAPETTILRALLQGRGIERDALGLIAARHALRDLELVQDPSTDDRPGAPLASGGRLVSATAPADRLAIAAEELDAWLAVANQHRSLRHAALTDCVSGAWNRRYFDLFLPRAVEDARRKRHDLSLLLFDIDDFKRFNDLFGHEAGDEILREVVRLMRCVVRPSDRVCRIGGDEFAVVFYEPEGPRTASSRHPTSITDIAGRFQAQIRDHRFPKLSARTAAKLSISGGLTTFPWDAHDAETLLRKADELTLQSKQLGKNVITLGPCELHRGRERPGS